MTDPTTANKNLTLPTVGSDDNVWGTLLNANSTLIDAALGGTLRLSLSGNTTLTSTQVQNTGYLFTGTLSVTTTVTFPSYFGFAAISNQTTGGKTLTITYGSGTTADIAAGEAAILWADGANFTRLSQSIINFPLGLGSGGTGADLSATGGVHQVLKQSTSGGVVTIGQLAASDISGLAASATTNTTDASNITIGTLPNGRLSAIPNTSLQNSTVVLSGHTIPLGSSLNLLSGDISGLAASATTDTTSATNISTGTLNNSRLSVVDLLHGGTGNTTGSVAATSITGTLPSAQLTGAYTGITGVGTLTGGTWHASAIDVAHGGTNAVTAAAAFINLVAPNFTLTQSGFMTLTNGLVIQWGVHSFSGSFNQESVSFPTAFPSSVFVVLTSLSLNAGQALSSGTNTITLTSFNFALSAVAANTGYFLAIGA